MFGKRKWAHAFAGPGGGGFSGHHDWWQSRMGHHHGGRGGGGPHGHGLFGMRRPLRFMARRLDLSEAQVAELAGIIHDLKTERAQARVDHQRALSEFASVFQGDTYDAERVKRAATARADAAGRVQDAVVKALARTFELLEPDQRRDLATLLRSGGLEI